eukprot:CAMPEP_0195511930 /NCGR_PEP_ID=MMETSP0794_2-20130614/4079_1 /TAXON_ID=515487 /ORGANISM="Stephanopyxis turris, Strain CCMP 815" /LENGTH=684 /DNA_ID=CAMNT_0040639621 /DNA_START=70 /DNA_END=2124 /DNA_ORIENTATION=-
MISEGYQTGTSDENVENGVMTKTEPSSSLQEMVSSGAAAVSFPPPESIPRDSFHGKKLEKMVVSVVMALLLLGCTIGVVVTLAVSGRKNLGVTSDNSALSNSDFLGPDTGGTDTPEQNLDNDEQTGRVDDDFYYKEPSEQDDSEIRFKAAKDYLRSITDVSKLEEKGSPQSVATRWIAEDKMAIPKQNDYESILARRFIERWALAVFYRATSDGLGWKSNLNFMSSADTCFWNSVHVTSQGITEAGVFCDENELVYNIFIDHNIGLHGTLPDELSLLHNLIGLIIEHNFIVGSIPSSVRELTQLEHLSLDYNQINGSVPPSIGSLTNLRVLSFSNNDITGSFPKSINMLTALEILAVDDNSMTGDFENLKTLTSLSDLYLEDNDFTGRLDNGVFEDLSDLIFLDASDNKLHGNLPSYLFDSTKFPGLELIDFNGNHFGGEFPTDIAENNALAKFFVHDNHINGSLEDVPWGNFKEMTHLDLSSNNFVGGVPSTFQNMGKLKYFYVANNTFTPGQIPEFLPLMTTLEELCLRNTSRTGTIPAKLGSLTNLYMLDLDDNALTNTVPKELGQLTNLMFLLLNRNQLTGTLPDELENFSKLQVLMLQKNNFTNATTICKNSQLIFGSGDCERSTGSKVCPCCHRCVYADDEEQDAFLLANYNPIWEYSYQRVKFEFGNQDIVKDYSHL